MPIKALEEIAPKNYDSIKLEHNENCGEDSSNSDSTKFNEDADELNCPYIFENDLENSNEHIRKLIKDIMEEKCSHKEDSNCIKTILNNT